MPDSSDRDLQLSKAKRVSGWYVDRSQVPDDPASQAMPTWLEFLERNPDATLPNGVGGAIIAHFHERLGRVYLKLAEANDEIEIDNQLLADRDRILDACPCPAHGRCVQYVLEQLKGLPMREPRHTAPR